MPSASQSPSSTGAVSLLHIKPATITVIAAGAVFVIFVVLAVVVFAVRRKVRKVSIESALSVDGLVKVIGHSRSGSSASLGSGSYGSSTSEARSIALSGNPYAALDPTPVAVPTSVYAPRVRRRVSGTSYRWADQAPFGANLKDALPHGPPPPYQQEQAGPLLRGRQQEERPAPLSLRIDVGSVPGSHTPSFHRRVPGSQHTHASRRSAPVTPSSRYSTVPDSSRRSVSQSHGPLSGHSVPESLMPASRRSTATFIVPFGESVTRASDEGRGEGVVDSRWSSRTRSTRMRKQPAQMPLPPPGGFPRFIRETVRRDDESWVNLGTVVDESRLLRVRHRFFFWLAVASVCPWLTTISAAR